MAQDAAKKREVLELTLEEWRELGEKVFGPNRNDWRYQCPICGHVAPQRAWIEAGAPAGAIGFACVGRWTGPRRTAFGDDSGPGPCDYTGGGLFGFNPIHVSLPDGRIVQLFPFDNNAVAASIEYTPA